MGNIGMKSADVDLISIGGMSHLIQTRHGTRGLVSRVSGNVLQTVEHHYNHVPAVLMHPFLRRGTYFSVN